MEETKVQRKKGDLPRLTWLAAFLLPFFLMLAIFIGNGIFPFGKRCFLFSDMYHQYMPFFQEMMRKIKAGEGLSYSWNVGMGSNFLALYVYYLASPFNWLAFLFPQKYLIEFMSYAVVCKIGLAGLTSWIYLRSRTGDKKNAWLAALFCSTFYAMSGFVAAYNWNVMWMDCVVLLPLILMGLERLVHKGKMGLYVVALGLCIFTNFYISIMICLFLVLYFIYLFLAEKRSFSMIWKFAAGSLLAGGLAAIFLVPEVKALMATDFGDMDFPKEWKSYFPIIDVLARHSMAITTERALEHWPNIYCGTMVFFMIPLYAINEKIPARRRLGFMTLAGIFLISFATNGLDFIWHGLNYPDSLPARQSFIYVLIVLVACYDCLTHLDGIKPVAIVKAALGAGAFMLCIEKFVDVSDFLTWTWLLNLAFIVSYAACLYIYVVNKKGWVRIITVVVAMAAVLSETAINMAYTSVGTTDRAAYLNHLEDYQALYERNRNDGNGFSRFEKFGRKTKNDATLAGFPSASVFSSTMNSYVMDFYTKMGMQHSKVYYGFDGATPFAAALLNVNYYFSDSEKWENELFKIKDEQNGIYLYEAVESLPFGYVAPKGFDLPEDARQKGILTQNGLLRDLGIEESILTKVTSEKDGDDVIFTPSEDGIYYGCVTDYGTAKIKMTGANPSEVNLKDLKKDVLFYVGFLEEGQRVTMTNGDSSDDTKKIPVAMYQLNVSVIKEALELLRERHMTDVKVGSSEISGKLHLEKEGRLILSIPYEKSWTALVNGQEKEPAKFGDAFIALDLDAGDYEIELNYEPEGKKLGIVITVVSLCIFVLFFIILPKGRAHRRNRKTLAGAEEMTEEKVPAGAEEVTGEKVPAGAEEVTGEKVPAGAEMMTKAEMEGQSESDGENN
ncbi:MAG: YfhO family protein [Acetatifactor sp.]|nr:YfhO family protein [Acetatifactor sp.]